MKKKVLKKIIYLFIPNHKPYFMILGAQKSGTTSLHSYLNIHPELVGSNPKEIDYFNFDPYYERGLNWYHSHFKTHKGLFRHKLYFESSPEYLYRSFVPERIYAYNKDLKFIVIMREPVSRAFSAWNMHRDFKFKNKELPFLVKHAYLNDKENNLYKELYAVPEYPSFESCVQSELNKIHTASALEEPSFLRKGIYIDQIERYLKYFEREQFLFLTTKELAKDKLHTLNKVTEFLAVKPLDWTKFNLYSKGKREYRESLSPEVKLNLEQFYAPYNERLFELTGKLDW